MKILVANLGSTSFKYRLLDMADESQLARGGIERIGSEESRCFVEIGPHQQEKVKHVPDQAEAVRQCLAQLTDPESGCLNDASEVSAIAFKAVHGDGNIEQARRLLKEAGYSESNPLSFDFWYTPSHYGDTEVDIAAVLKNQFEATGVMKVNVKSAEWAAYRDNWANKVMPVWLLGWYPDYIDPDNYTSAFAGTAGSKGLGIHFSNPAWDQKLVEGQTTTDMDVRTRAYQTLQQWWTQDVPTAPIFQGSLYLFSQKNVSGITISPTLQFIYSPIHLVK